MCFGLDRMHFWNVKITFKLYCSQVERSFGCERPSTGLSLPPQEPDRQENESAKILPSSSRRRQSFGQLDVLPRGKWCSELLSFYNQALDNRARGLRCEDLRGSSGPRLFEAKIQSSYRARGQTRPKVNVHIEPEGPEEPRGIPMIGPISGPRLFEAKIQNDDRARGPS